MIECEGGGLEVGKGLRLYLSAAWSLGRVRTGPKLKDVCRPVARMVCQSDVILEKVGQMASTGRGAPLRKLFVYQVGLFPPFEPPAWTADQGSYLYLRIQLLAKLGSD